MMEVMPSTAGSSPRSAEQRKATQRNAWHAQRRAPNAWHTQLWTTHPLDQDNIASVPLLTGRYASPNPTQTQHHVPKHSSILTVTFPAPDLSFAHQSSPSLDERTAMYPFVCGLVQGLFLEEWMYNHSLASAPCMSPLLHYPFFSLYLSLLHPRVCVVFSNIHISDPGNQTITQPEGPILNRADPWSGERRSYWGMMPILTFPLFSILYSLIVVTLFLLSTFVKLLMTSSFFSFQLQKCLSQLIQVKNKWVSFLQVLFFSSSFSHFVLCFFYLRFVSHCYLHRCMGNIHVGVSACDAAGI